MNGVRTNAIALECVGRPLGVPHCTSRDGEEILKLKTIKADLKSHDTIDQSYSNSLVAGERSVLPLIPMSSVATSRAPVCLPSSFLCPSCRSLSLSLSQSIFKARFPRNGSFDPPGWSFPVKLNFAVICSSFKVPLDSCPCDAWTNFQENLGLDQ